MATAQVNLPPKIAKIFERPLGSWRYRGAYGGRGSGKSLNFAKMAAIYGYSQSLRILCTREFQASIKESFHAELKRAIESEPWLASAYDVGVDYIRCITTGTEFIFRGLRRNENSIKSLADIDITIVEEAEDVPESAWLALEATVLRNEGSEIWPIWNPRERGSPIDRRLRVNRPDNAIVDEVNWQDNPFFPSGLDDLRRRQQKTLDHATYAWIWDGAYLEVSELQVFHNWKIDECQPDFDNIHFGADWGFSQDPTVLLRTWIDETNQKIYIDEEVYQVGLDIDMTPDAFRLVRGACEYKIRGDSARPEMISYLNKNGFKIESVKKGANSVETGITWLKGYEIIIHPRCKNTIKEFRTFKYKQNSSGDILPKTEDKNNHAIDALRYAYEPMILGSGRYNIRTL